MTHVWFSADHHFGHENIIKYCSRPFSCAAEMDEFLIKRWNAVVEPNDVVWYLGDFSMSLEKALGVTPLLNGRKNLIAGNHDKCSGEKASHIARRDAFLAAGWESVQDFLLMNICGKEVLLSHFPYEGHDPFAKGMPCPRDEGFPLIHGHVHNHWKTKDCMINVGVDVWDFAPVRGDDIAALLSRVSFV
jgi:calcineurin-like phosphoesterase family protein